MKKFTKLFLSCAAVTAVTAAVATSAMAAAVTGDLTGTYDEGTGTLTLDAAATPAGVATILVLDAGANETAVENKDILYINQKDAETASFGNMGLLNAPKAEDTGVYKVKVGYYDNDKFAIKTAQFTIGNVGTEITVGDGNLDSKINTADSVLLARYLAKFTEGIGSVGKEYADAADSSKAVFVGDGNSDAKINTADSVLLARYLAKFTEGIGNIGGTATVVEK